MIIVEDKVVDDKNYAKDRKRSETKNSQPLECHAELKTKRKNLP